MAVRFKDPQYDVVIVGSGIVGALIASQLAAKKLRVLILEAGGVAPESLSRYELLNSYTASAAKATDAPFCGDNILAAQPDPRNTSDPTKALQPANYYYYPPGYDKNKMFKSFYERLVGGSTWHWQALYVRMLPTDFTLNSSYHVKHSVDWPFGYHHLEPYYVRVEKRIGVAGSREDYAKPRFKNPMSSPYPMRELAPSYLDKQVGKAINKEMMDARLEGMPDMQRELISLRVTPVPHAINSVPHDGRPACDGRTSCVPLCTIKARYEAIVDLEKAIAEGATLRKQAVVTRLELDSANGRVTGVHYIDWKWQEDYAKPEENGKRAKISEGYATGRVIVLAANGIENPMILMRSGAARSCGDVLGGYLMDHPIKQSFALAKQPLFPYRGPQTTSHIEGFRDGQFRRVYAAFKCSLKNDGWASTAVSWPRGSAFPIKQSDDWLPGSIVDLVGKRGYSGAQLRDFVAHHGTRQITLNSACEQLPIIGNRVSQAPEKDDLDLPRPQISYDVFDNDDGYMKRSFQKVVEFHGRVFDLMGVDKKHRFMMDDQDTFKFYLGSGHIMGTTRMGKKDARTEAVVDPDCRCYDHANLFVVGSSVFPTGAACNPTATIAALALRAADKIEDDLRRGYH